MKQLPLKLLAITAVSSSLLAQNSKYSVNQSIEVESTRESTNPQSFFNFAYSSDPQLPSSAEAAVSPASILLVSQIVTTGEYSNDGNKNPRFAIAYNTKVEDKLTPQLMMNPAIEGVKEDIERLGIGGVIPPIPPEPNDLGNVVRAEHFASFYSTTSATVSFAHHQTSTRGEINPNGRIEMGENEDAILSDSVATNEPAAHLIQIPPPQEVESEQLLAIQSRGTGHIEALKVFDFPNAESSEEYMQCLIGKYRDEAAFVLGRGNVRASELLEQAVQCFMNAAQAATNKNKDQFNNFSDAAYDLIRAASLVERVNRVYSNYAGTSVLPLVLKAYEDAVSFCIAAAQAAAQGDKETESILKATANNTLFAVRENPIED
ncbi:MAG: hypothetical protein A3F67_07565 [Verrucomicrobia bacterium RIFCSPHIGHO2_12_FULL_41_10]|nr:MAG: hypothetical protein A3F67_07565 [Verrucomicrobia bacterium RIFCSPHIGHO2_12_FULL_41_10]